MPHCNITERCWFYRQKKKLTSPEFNMFQKYCNGRYMDCARYQVAQYYGFRYVPKGLQPNEIGQIKGVLRSLCGWVSSVSYIHLAVRKLIPFRTLFCGGATILLIKYEVKKEINEKENRTNSARIGDCVCAANSCRPRIARKGESHSWIHKQLVGYRLGAY